MLARDPRAQALVIGALGADSSDRPLGLPPDAERPTGVAGGPLALVILGAGP